MYLFKLWYSLDVCPEVGLQDHMATSSLVLLAFFFFYFLFLAALSLHCYTQAFSSCSKQAFLSTCSAQLFIAVTPLVAGHRLQGAWASGVMA